MYPKNHPYSWPVIGSMTDLSAASEEDVKAFFRLYYAPNNATLAVVGDFDPAQTKAWIQKYFVDLPQGKTVERPRVPLGNLAASKRLVYEDRVQVPRLSRVPRSCVRAGPCASRLDAPLPSRAPRGALRASLQPSYAMP